MRRPYEYLALIILIHIYFTFFVSFFFAKVHIVENEKVHFLLQRHGPGEQWQQRRERPGEPPDEAPEGQVHVEGARDRHGGWKTEEGPAG